MQQGYNGGAVQHAWGAMYLAESMLKGRGRPNCGVNGVGLAGLAVREANSALSGIGLTSSGTLAVKS